MVLSLFGNWINCDTAYYLSIVERIADGYVPYKTLHCSYPPLFFYLMAGVKAIFQIPYGCFQFYQGLIYLFTLGTAFYLYKISREFYASKEISFISAWLFVIIAHWVEGNYVLLEIPSIFFGLASCYFILRSSRLKMHPINFIWIGILSCGAFLCKQFGIGFFFLGLFLIIQGSKKISRIVWFCLGYLVPLIICSIIWDNFLPNLILTSYGTGTAADAGWDISITHKLGTVVKRLAYFFIRIVPFCLFSFLLFRELKKKKSTWKFIFCWLGILGFSLQYLFTSEGLHYSLYMLPFGVLLIPVCSATRGESSKYARITFSVGLSLTILMGCISTYYKRVWFEYIKQTPKQFVQYMDNDLKKEIQEIIRPGETVWMQGTESFYLYYLANVLPPNLSTIGYSFCSLGLTKKDAMSQATTADWVLCNAYCTEPYVTPELTDFIEQHPYTSLVKDDEIRLYRISE